MRVGPSQTVVFIEFLEWTEGDRLGTRNLSGYVTIKTRGAWSKNRKAKLDSNSFGV
jgi:hypothetical protein